MSNRALSSEQFACPTCGSDKVTNRGGVLTDVAAYPNGARYPRGPHSKTCLGAAVAPPKYSAAERQVAQVHLDLASQGHPVPEEMIAKARAILDHKD